MYLINKLTSPGVIKAIKITGETVKITLSNGSILTYIADRVGLYAESIPKQEQYGGHNG